jgi:hypothetical protein
LVRLQFLAQDNGGDAALVVVVLVVVVVCGYVGVGKA